MKKFAPVAAALIALVASIVGISFCVSYAVSQVSAEAPHLVDTAAARIGTFAAQVHAAYEKGSK